MDNKNENMDDSMPKVKISLKTLNEEKESISNKIQKRLFLMISILIILSIFTVLALNKFIISSITCILFIAILILTSIITMKSYIDLQARYTIVNILTTMQSKDKN